MIDIRGWEQLKLYERNSGVLSYAERLVRRLVNKYEKEYCRLLPYEELCSIEKQKAQNVVVSLTSFPERINEVELSIKSLIHQTVRPEKIILWLAKKQFENVKIPSNLRNLCQYGLEICFCEEDILAHKKYYYSMLEYPEKVIITYDDDLIYPEDSIENLLNAHKSNPNAIVCNRGREIVITKKGDIAPYKYWDTYGKILAGTPSYRIMASTGAGTLYPAGCMPEQTFDINKIKKLALTADDLWMKVMSIYAEIPVVRTSPQNKGLCPSGAAKGVTLAKQNVEQKANDIVMKNLLLEYPMVKAKLLEEDINYGK